MSHESLGEGYWCSGLMRPRWSGLKRRWCSRDGGGRHHRVGHPRERGGMNHPHWAIPRGWHALMMTRYGYAPE
jgi:hypothetical protein